MVIVSFLAFFEEVGWRAWLLPRLVDRLGMRRGIWLTAVIWAFWHTPYVLSGIQHIDGFPVLRTALIVPIGTIGPGLVIGWLWVRTESIWIVSIAHGAFNNWGQYRFQVHARESRSARRPRARGRRPGCTAVGSVLVMRGVPSAPPAAALGRASAEC